MIEGVTLSELKMIKGEKGNVLHALKASDIGFSKFGEAYFSTVRKGEIKGWKKHYKMTLNLIVPTGTIKFVIYDDRDDSHTKNQFFSLNLGPETNYKRLTINPGLFVAFKGVGSDLNLLLNIADIEHDPSEAKNLDINQIHYEYW